MKCLIQYEFGKILKRKIVCVGILALLVFGVILYTGSGPMGETAMLPDGTYVAGSKAVSYNRQVAERYKSPLTEETVQEILEEFAPGTLS